MEATIENALMEIGDLHKSVDASKLREVGAKVFAFVDQKGHVIDFDDAWRWAGYSKRRMRSMSLRKTSLLGRISSLMLQSQHLRMKGNTVVM